MKTRDEMLLHQALESLLHRIQHPHSMEELGQLTHMAFRTTDMQQVVAKAAAALEGMTVEQAALRRADLAYRDAMLVMDRAAGAAEKAERELEALIEQGDPA